MSRILLVYKRSFLERHREDRHVLKRLEPGERGRLLRADVEIRRTLSVVREEIQRRGLGVDVVYRGVVTPKRRYDLLITVGGDGTFFLASHFAGTTPVLGVNSDPERSLGLHCGADRGTFGRVLDLALAGRARITKLNRLSVSVNGARLPVLALNDVLFAHRSPAQMTRYVVSVDGRRERQKGSGIWIATASGSTAAIRASGGWRMPLSSTRMQFRVREPYPWPGRPRMTAGEARRSIDITALVAEGAVWIDGANRRFDTAFGDRIEILTGATPLAVVRLDESRRRKLFP